MPPAQERLKNRRQKRASTLSISRQAIRAKAGALFHFRELTFPQFRGLAGTARLWRRGNRPLPWPSILPPERSRAIWLRRISLRRLLRKRCASLPAPGRARQKEALCPPANRAGNSKAGPSLSLGAQSERP